MLYKNSITSQEATLIITPVHKLTYVSYSRTVELNTYTTDIFGHKWYYRHTWLIYSTVLDIFIFIYIHTQLWRTTDGTSFCRVCVPIENIICQYRYI